MVLNGYVSSKVLGTETGISIYAPEKAVIAQGSYKVVYLLHGLHGNSQFWLNNTMLTSFAGGYGAIFVMPEVGRSFYTNQRHGYDYFTYLTEELPFLAKSVFNISAKREDTAVMGCSMGAFGALKAALTKPEQYSFCGAISSAFLFAEKNLGGLRTPERESWLKESPENEMLLKDLENIFGKDLESTDADSAVKLAEKALASKHCPQVYAACGLQDGLCAENREYAQIVKKLGLPYTYEEWKGGHDWQFFNDALKKALDLWDCEVQ